MAEFLISIISVGGSSEEEGDDELADELLPRLDEQFTSNMIDVAATAMRIRAFIFIFRVMCVK